MALPQLPTLAEIQAALWQGLTRATRDKHHAWRTPVLATIANDADGQPLADARTVVLREVDAAAQQLLLFTDARSAKVAQIAAQPLGTLVLWSPQLGWQLRLRLRLQVQADGLAQASRWARLKLTPAAQDYLSPLPPGAEQAGGDATPHGAAVQPARESRGHFAVLAAEVTSIDWLELHPAGHRRARFDSAGARWLVP